METIGKIHSFYCSNFVAKYGIAACLAGLIMSRLKVNKNSVLALVVLNSLVLVVKTKSYFSSLMNILFNEYFVVFGWSEWVKLKYGICILKEKIIKIHRNKRGLAFIKFGKAKIHNYGSINRQFVNLITMSAFWLLKSRTKTNKKWTLTLNKAKGTRHGVWTKIISKFQIKRTYRTEHRLVHFPANKLEWTISLEAFNGNNHHSPFIIQILWMFIEKKKNNFKALKNGWKPKGNERPHSTHCIDKIFESIKFLLKATK